MRLISSPVHTHRCTTVHQDLKGKVDSLLAAGKLFVVDHELLEVRESPACMPRPRH